MLELIMTPLQSSTQSEVITDDIVTKFYAALEYYAGFSREVSYATIKSALLSVADDIVDKKKCGTIRINWR
jgi:cyanate lyase